MKTSRQKADRTPRNKTKKIRKYMRGKLVFAFSLTVGLLLVLTVVMITIIQGKGEEYSKTVLSQQNYSSSVLPFRRGTITDRNQTVLAASEQVYSLILDPAVIAKGNEASVNATVEALVNCFGYDRSDIEQKLADNAESSYVRYAKQLTEEQKTAFEEYEETFEADAENKKNSVKINGIWFESEYKRVYPYNSLASTVLGFSGSDSSQGNWGIEQEYNSYLVGVNGREYGYLNDDGTVERTVKNATDGNTVVTTLDYTVQKAAEDAIANFLEDVDAENVGVLVMNPNNGEILAMASSSSYDLNNPDDLTGLYTKKELKKMSDEEKSDARNKMWRNFMISDTYEPGSTAKAFTAAAMLEEALATKEDTYVCDGGQSLANGSVYVQCAHKHGSINFQEALAFSCNDAMMQMASKMGKHVFASYQALFGLGNTTGIDLPGEASGILYQEDDMSSVDLATNAFGQNFTVTMVQMAAAYSSILNGGSYYQPHIVKKIVSPEGEVIEEIGDTLVRETVSESTAQTIREALEMTVNEGTGTTAAISGYTVGGKTGTAEKYPRGNGKYLLSFMGFAPVESPELLVYVIVDEPDLDEDEISATLAIGIEREVMSSVLEYLNVPATGEVSEETQADGESTDTENQEENVSGEGILQGDDGPPEDSDEASADNDNDADNNDDNADDDNADADGDNADADDDNAEADGDNADADDDNADADGDNADADDDNADNDGAADQEE